MSPLIQTNINENLFVNSIDTIENLNFVKWAGGKTQLLQQIAIFLPKKIENYYEPFIGGGAVFFYIMQKYKPKYAYISDMNKELIITYQVIRDNVEKLIELLKKHKLNHTEEYFYKIREQDVNRLSAIEIAGRFIYLNKTCFNGLYRVNSKGKFNVPIGSYKNPSIFDEDKLRIISKILSKNVEIVHASFEEIKVKPKSFVYFDPPYYPLDGKKSFTTYTKNSFMEKEQENLSQLFTKLNKERNLVMLSNSDTSFIRNLYKSFTTHTVYAKRMINCDGKNRGEITEILVVNY